jgi:hypothetical protein
MLTLNQARDLLERCSFRIRIEKDKQGNWEFGTGFFITPNGYALTAFHNLPKRAVKNGRGRVKVFYRNLSKPLWLVWRPDLSDRDSDIAVLQLPKPGGVAFEWLTPAFLSPDLPHDERLEFWRGMTDLLVFGFPVRNVGRHQRWRGAGCSHAMGGRSGGKLRPQRDGGKRLRLRTGSGGAKMEGRGREGVARPPVRDARPPAVAAARPSRLP